LNLFVKNLKNFHRKNRGEHVNEKDLRKHKYDVFRLLQIVSVGEVIKLQGLVKENAEQFIMNIQNENLSLEQIGLPFSKSEAVQLLKELYEL